MKLTRDDLDKITGSKRYPARKEAFCTNLGEWWPCEVGKAETALILAQVLHESGAFRYVREVWGPTAAQKGYEGRADLGNVHPGDGKRFMGHGLNQITGRANHMRITEWSRANLGLANSPDFVEKPELLGSLEWLGIDVMWYWLTRINPRHIDSGDVENISRTVNGGTNGLIDRFNWYSKSAMVLMGRSRNDVRGFQEAAGIEVDGAAGPVTRAAMHKALQQYDRNARVAPFSKVEIYPVSPPAPKPAPRRKGTFSWLFGGAK